MATWDDVRELALALPDVEEDSGRGTPSWRAQQRLVFENPAHDFPRRLEYVRDGAGQMTVRVTDGKDKGFTLQYRRQLEKAS